MSEEDKDRPITTAMAAITAELLDLDHGVVWRCATCPMQSYWIHGTVAGARHDALGHVLAVHQDDVHGAEMTLALAHIGEKQFRQEYREALEKGTVMDQSWGEEIPLSPADALDTVCTALGCPAEAAHQDCW
ncbi:hypothetical protein GXW82_44640 [Streptacidiphilus sp. 4-A2]|nr:hypothetical protein [Streptacidiphilus sp. 4-A2]